MGSAFAVIAIMLMFAASPMLMVYGAFLLFGPGGACVAGAVACFVLGTFCLQLAD